MCIRDRPNGMRRTSGRVEQPPANSVPAASPFNVEQAHSNAQGPLHAQFAAICGKGSFACGPAAATIGLAVVSATAYGTMLFSNSWASQLIKSSGGWAELVFLAGLGRSLGLSGVLFVLGTATYLNRNASAEYSVNTPVAERAPRDASSSSHEDERKSNTRSVSPAR